MVHDEAATTYHTKPKWNTPRLLRLLSIQLVSVRDGVYVRMWTEDLQSSENAGERSTQPTHDPTHSVSTIPGYTVSSHWIWNTPMGFTASQLWKLKQGRFPCLPPPVLHTLYFPQCLVDTWSYPVSRRGTGHLLCYIGTNGITFPVLLTSTAVVTRGSDYLQLL